MWIQTITHMKTWTTYPVRESYGHRIASGQCARTRIQNNAFERNATVTNFVQYHNEACTVIQPVGGFVANFNRDNLPSWTLLSKFCPPSKLWTPLTRPSVLPQVTLSRSSLYRQIPSQTRLVNLFTFFNLVQPASRATWHASPFPRLPPGAPSTCVLPKSSYMCNIPRFPGRYLLHTELKN